MSFQYLTVEKAIPAPGLRMVVVGNVPSPWGEAAKGIFHLKRIPFSAVRLAYDNDALRQWTGGALSGPVAIYNDEIPRTGWAEILMLAERLAPEPALLPLEPLERARALSVAEKFCAPDGLGWTRRLQVVHAGLTGAGGFKERVAGYLGKKYGYDAAHAPDYGARVRQLLGELAATLRERRGEGPYYLGRTLSAADIYSATFMALFVPLPEIHCAMHPDIRAAFEWLDDETAAALPPILVEHRDMMYARHLELPLSL
jgi:glutathione S-transferase